VQVGLGQQRAPISNLDKGTNYPDWYCREFPQSVQSNARLERANWALPLPQSCSPIHVFTNHRSDGGYATESIDREAVRKVALLIVAYLFRTLHSYLWGIRHWRRQRGTEDGEKKEVKKGKLKWQKHKG
jgi:hypothetical protein